MTPLKSIPVLVMLASIHVAAAAQGDHEAAPALKLSTETRELLRAEMRAITGGIQAIAAAIATGDLETVAESSARISASYIMEQRLTARQREELQALPEHFHRLDRRFHQDATRLTHAAEQGDAELAAFRYYRLVDSCVACHSAYAAHRFPGLRQAAPAHGH